MCAFLGTKMGIFRKCLELSKMVRNAKIIVLTQSLIVSHNDQILVSDSIPVSHSIQYEILLASLLAAQHLKNGEGFQGCKPKSSDILLHFETILGKQRPSLNLHIQTIFKILDMGLSTAKNYQIELSSKKSGNN